jgi:hypothetical protein
MASFSEILKYFQTITTLTKLQIVACICSSAKWSYIGHCQNSQQTLSFSALSTKQGGIVLFTTFPMNLPNEYDYMQLYTF